MRLARRAPWRRRAPRPPENVRIMFDDGTVIPVECTYRGREDGHDVWRAVMPVDVTGHPVFWVQADVLPARSTVEVAFQRRERL